MKRILTIGLACLSLGLAGAASAQTMTTSHSHVAPNGSVHTTTRVRGPIAAATARVTSAGAPMGNGTAATTTFAPAAAATSSSAARVAWKA